MNFDLSQDLVKMIHTADTLFADIDKAGDSQISWDEFTAYVKKRQPDQNDQKEVLREFEQLDTNKDGYI